MAREHYTQLVADELRGEVVTHAMEIAEALAPPEESATDQAVSDAKMIEHVRYMSYQPPEQGKPPYLAGLLDNMAPAAIPGPDGTMLRSQIGLKRYHSVIHRARPDIYSHVMLSPEGA